MHPKHWVEIIQTIHNPEVQQTVHSVPKVTETHRVDVKELCTYHHMPSAYIKLKETFLNSVI